MPKQFTGSVDAPANLRFGANEFVDDSNSLEQLPAAAKALATASTNLVLHSFADQQNAEITKQDELYSEARTAKQGMYDSALAGDTAAVNEYASKLSDLKVAERQGAISGTNSQIRQETLLKSYINRYPHLEETIRQQYSSTRARAQSEREQFKDPIEAGMDALLERSYAAGRNPARQIEFEQGKADLEMKKEMLTYNSMLGTNIQPDVDVLFENQGRLGAVMDVQNYISQLVNDSVASGREISADEAKAGLRTRAELYKRDWRIYLSDIISKSKTPEAVLSKEYVDGKLSEIDKIFNDQASMIDSVDTLNALARASEISKHRTLNEIAEIHPVFGMLARLSPNTIGEVVFDRFSERKRIFLNGGMSALQIEKEKSTGIDSALIDFQIPLFGTYKKDGKAQARDLETSFQRGAALQPSGSTQLDAARVGLVTSTVLESGTAFDEEQKANALRSAVESEKQLSRPGEYFAPSHTFYTNPARAQELRENPRAKMEMTQTLENDAPGIVANVRDPVELGALFFKPQMEAEANNARSHSRASKTPWDLYPAGGPWGSSLIPASQAMPPQMASTWLGRISRGAQNHPGGTGLATPTGRAPLRQSGGIGVIIGALNNDYWIWRNMHGAASAEAHARDIMEEINKSMKEMTEPAKDAQQVDMTD